MSAPVGIDHPGSLFDPEAPITRADMDALRKDMAALREDLAEGLAFARQAHGVIGALAQGGGGPMGMMLRNMLPGIGG
ncbi:hypothetical protein ACWCPQ_34275 [Nocardia sp. NPDC001965]